MRATIYMTTICGCLAAAAIHADEPLPMKIEVRKLDLSGVASKAAEARSSPQREGVEIADKEQLAAAFPDEPSQTAINKQVDFSKEKLVLFLWAGSGQDKLVAEVVKAGDEPAVEFQYSPGRTRDLRSHVYLFAIPKALTWKKVVKRA